MRGDTLEPLDPPGWSLSDQVSNLSRRGRFVLVIALVVAGLLGVGAWYRIHYGLWPGAQYPATLHYCDRSYTEQGLTPHAVPGTTLHHAYDYAPPFATSYAVYSPNPEGVHVGDTETCTAVLYLETNRDRFIPYFLEGTVG